MCTRSSNPTLLRMFKFSLSRESMPALPMRAPATPLFHEKVQACFACRKASHSNSAPLHFHVLLAQHLALAIHSEAKLLPKASRVLIRGRPGSQAK
mmetsp:Transcript_42154/g.74161  ORF Transcript_42154/g.74161 Transcript_42154/m.74161 type:complete len:96 (-) Transcript_42154:329-616(-)